MEMASYSEYWHLHSPQRWRASRCCAIARFPGKRKHFVIVPRILVRLMMLASLHLPAGLSDRLPTSKQLHVLRNWSRVPPRCTANAMVSARTAYTFPSSSVLPLRVVFYTERNPFLISCAQHEVLYFPSSGR